MELHVTRLHSVTQDTPTTSYPVLQTAAPPYLDGGLRVARIQPLQQLPRLRQQRVRHGRGVVRRGVAAQVDTEPKYSNLFITF
jgi:hypothetical protein